MEEQKARWRRLRCGAWGLAIPREVSPGDVVDVLRRDGTTERRTVGRLVWQGWRPGGENGRGAWVTEKSSAAAGDVCATLAFDGGEPSSEPETVSGEIIATTEIPATAVVPVSSGPRMAPIWPRAASPTPRADRARARKAAKLDRGVRTTPGFDF